MSNMVVVISDLHFEEERSDAIATFDPQQPIALRRNVRGRVFERLIADVVGLAHERSAVRIDFVLAGDVFDLHRTQLWFADDCPPDVRPFVHNNEVGDGSPLERKVLSILDAIASEEEVKKSIEAFQRLAQGLYLVDTVITKVGRPVTLHYLPGNHDRLANASPAIRRRVRELLKLDGGDALFPHNFMFKDPNVFIRHGHEYDPANFGSKLRGRRIERDIRSELYDRPTLGDFVTIQVASRLPNLFRKHYDGQIATDPVLRTIYLRLLEFDDLRPQSHVVNFILDIMPPMELAARYKGRRDEWQQVTWRKVEPVIRALLDDVRTFARPVPQDPAPAPLVCPAGPDAPAMALGPAVGAHARRRLGHELPRQRRAKPQSGARAGFRRRCRLRRRRPHPHAAGCPSLHRP